ncbi:MAG: GNAT family N-acetyltransferase [Anaerolineae bacterium]
MLEWQAENDMSASPNAQKSVQSEDPAGPVQRATPEDIDAWLQLAAEVEPLFGPMVDDPGFRKALEEAVAEGRALCIRESSAGPGAPLCGGVIVATRTNEIAWLAVAAAHRRRGFGGALLAEAIALLAPERDIQVQTFAPNVEAGRAARALYQRFGFRDHHKAEPAPSGLPTVVMVRPSR